MANTYALNIIKIRCKTDVENLDNVAHRVYYEYVVTDENGESASIMDAVILSDPDPDNFIAFEDLTEAQVVGWMDLNEDAIRADLDARLARKLTPPLVDKRAPWLPPVEEPTGDLL